MKAAKIILRQTFDRKATLATHKITQGKSFWLYIYLLACLVFLLFRARYGFCFNDEPFIVSLGQRLYRGDALIVDEWHVSQLFSVVMLPFFAVFRIFSPDNEGILLCLRIVYCMIWWCTSVFVSKTLARDLKRFICIFTYLVLFSPLDYMTISYTSMALISALVISCIIYIGINVETTAFSKNHRHVVYLIVFSISWAVLVLSSPYMLFGYCLSFAVILALYKQNNEKFGCTKELFCLYKNSLYLLSILAGLVIVFFLLLRTDISTAKEALPYIFNDPTHGVNLIISLRDTVYFVCAQWPLYMVISALSFAYGLCSRKKRFRVLIFFLNCALYVLGQVIVVSIPYKLNVQMLYIAVLGAVAFSLLEKRNYKLFFTFYGMGIFFAFMQNATSNTGIFAISMAVTVAGASSFVFILDLMNELCMEDSNLGVQKSIVFVISLTLCIQLSSEVFVKIGRQYWDVPPYQMNQTIQCGAAKGLKTSITNKEKYEATYYGLTALLDSVDTEGKAFLSCTFGPYFYLDADLDIASFSCWTYDFEDVNERQLSYQKISGKIPELIFCADDKDLLPLVDEKYTKHEINGYCLYDLQG